jgi:uncharacterized protein YlxW (UPF0749 family)
MLGLDKIVSRLSSGNIRNIKNRVENGIDKIRGYTEKGINRTREYLETAKYVIPSALINTLIFSNRFGLLGYYGAKAFVCYKMSKGGTGGNGYSKVFPIIVGITSGILGLGIGIFLGDHFLSNQYHEPSVDIQQQIQYLKNEVQELQQQELKLQNEVQNLESLLQSLESAYQNAEQQLQNINTLTDVLFGKGNSNDISVIQINSVQVVNGYAVVSGTVYSTGENVTLGIPISYVENGNVNIQEFVNDVQQYGWNPYILIDRADLQNMTLLNNQNGTYVISIQPNEPINIGVMASPANGSTLDNVLNQLTKYNIVIQDSSTVYGSSTALWGWNNPSESSVIVNFQNSNQYQLAETMINIADDIINSPGNQNPTSSGIIYTYSIFQGSLTINTNQGYPQYNVGSTYIPLIVLQSGQGNTIISDVSS